MCSMTNKDRGHVSHVIAEVVLLNCIVCFLPFVPGQWQSVE